ncbi:hypothetical protein QR680_013289 [Steinernema hermaphroditum]|uniref:Major facilitator superfamily (MFS) profile domain-containing protein n=1 Tax=Steinernema hermaphroditum TaxID=289476 RepID=A0AA39I7T5_9BILA|nr:hypothetical protein QR680_013289 [Steinernema hermaphroditum]
MGDKAILTEVLEASNLTDTYSNLTSTSILRQLKHTSTGSGSHHNESAIRYEGLEDEKVEIEAEHRVEEAPSEQTFTVDDCVEYLGFGRFQVKLSILTGIAWMADAMEMMILSIISPALNCEWEISAVQQAMITTVVFSGMMLSSTVWGKVCDVFGRRTGLMLSALLTFSMGALSAIAPNFNTMLLLRGLTGIGIGGVPQSVTLYAEFLPSAQRAKCVVLIEAFWAVGAAFEALLALFIMETWGWRWLLVFSALPLLFFSFSCFWLPESARYYMASGRPEMALKTLQKVARENGKMLPEGKLIDRAIHKSQSRGNFVSLFVPNLRTTTILLWFIWMCNAFCYYGIVLFTTVLFQSTDECHGGHPLNETLNTTASECRPLVQADYFDLLSTTLAEFPGLIITATVIEFLGRKKTMALEFSVYSVFTFLLVFCLDRRLVTAFIFIARAFISGAFQCVYVYTPEVYPTTLRALGLGTSSAMARLGAIVTPFVAQVAAGQNVLIPIVTYGLSAVAGVIASMALPIETKGRQMMESH